MRKLVGWLVAVGCFGVAAAPAAAATCSEADSAIALEAPSYVNAGKAFTVDVESYALDDGVSGFTIVIDGVVTAHTPAGMDWSTVGVVAPAGRGRFQMTVMWEQAEDAGRAGSPPCSGLVEHELTVVRRSARIGFTDAPRVDGRWRVILTPLNYADGTVSGPWTPSPMCDVGACSFRGDKRGIVFATDEGTQYTSFDEPARPTATCQVTVTEGGRVVSRRNIRRAYLQHSETELHPTKSRRLASGLLRATRLEGVVRATFTPTGEARAKGCRRTIFTRTRVVAIRG